MKHRQMRKIRQSGRKVKCHPRIFTKNLRSRVLPFTKGALETKEDDEDSDNKSNTKRYSTNEEEGSKDEARCEMTNTLTTHMVPTLDYKIQEVSKDPFGEKIFTIFPNLNPFFTLFITRLLIDSFIEWYWRSTNK